MHELRDDSLITMKFMTADTGYTPKYFYSQIKKGMLPKPEKFGRDSRWLYRDFKKWKSLYIRPSEGEE